MTGWVSDYHGELEDLDIMVELGGPIVSAEVYEGACWRARDVQLPPTNTGNASVHVDVEDGSGNQAEITAPINTELNVYESTDLVFNPQRNEFYFLEWGVGRIYAVKANTGEIGIVSGPELGEGPELRVADLAIDIDAENPENTRLLALTVENILEIDLNSGNRRALIPEPAVSPSLNSMSKFAIDQQANLAYVAKWLSIEGEGVYDILAVDMGNGSRVTVSGVAVGTGELITRVTDMALNVSDDVLYIHDPESDGVVSVDLDTGNRNYFSNAENGAGDTSFLESYSGYLVYEQTNKVIYSASGNDNVLYSIDAEGNREKVPVDLSGFQSARHGGGLSLSADARTLYLGQRSPHGLLVIDLETLAVSELRQTNTVESRPLVQSEGLAYLNGLESLVYKYNNDLFEYGLGDGSLALLNENFRGSALAEGITGDSIIYSHSDFFGLLEIDISTKSTSTISSGLSGSGEFFGNKSANFFSIDKENAKIYAFNVVDQKLVEISMANGDRQLIADSSTLASRFSSISDMHYNPRDGRIYLLAESDGDGLFSISPLDGSSILEYRFSTQTELGVPKKFAVSSLEDVFYFSTTPSYTNRNTFIFQLSMDDYSYTIIANNGVYGEGVFLNNLVDLKLDEQNQRLIASDWSNILVIDLISGDRVKLLKSND
ncbi:hypothetical protein SAMN02745866_03577 [Alteromonadaceae bacterium Bs31]|nr:hypothetical protein SAMN02745866_03577 [Alteromonadaceae bacterium Bs31]